MDNKVTKEDIYEMFEIMKVQKEINEGNKHHYYHFFEIGDTVTITTYEQRFKNNKKKDDTIKEYEGKIVGKDQDGIVLESIGGVFEKAFGNGKFFKDKIYLKNENILSIRKGRK